MPVNEFLGAPVAEDPRAGEEPAAQVEGAAPDGANGSAIRAGEPESGGPDEHSSAVMEAPAAAAVPATTVEDESAASPRRVPLTEWCQLAAEAVKRRQRLERKRLETWAERGRVCLAADISRAEVPGLAALEDIRFSLTTTEPGVDKSPLEVILWLEQAGTEVSVSIDTVMGRSEIFSSEMPARLIVPATGRYIVTAGVSNVLLQPCTDVRPEAKVKLRVRVYLRGRTARSGGW